MFAQTKATEENIHDRNFLVPKFLGSRGACSLGLLTNMNYRFLLGCSKIGFVAIGIDSREFRQLLNQFVRSFEGGIQVAIRSAFQIVSLGNFHGMPNKNFT